MGEQPPPLDSLQALQTLILGGQDVSNERMAALLPHLEAGGPATNEMESSGAVCYLGLGETAQYPFMASKARQLMLGRPGQRGGLLCANASRMGLPRLESSKRERQAKRARGEAAADGSGRFYPSQGPGTATTFLPVQTASPPRLAIRRTTYLDVNLARKREYDGIAAEGGHSPAKDWAERLPDTWKWSVAEFYPMVPLPAEGQRQSSIQKATRQGSMLWLEVDNLPLLTKKRDVLQIVGLCRQVDGYRRVDEVEDSSVGFGGLANMPELPPQLPLGACVRLTHRPAPSLALFYWRLPQDAHQQQLPAVPLQLPLALPGLDHRTQHVVAAAQSGMEGIISPELLQQALAMALQAMGQAPGLPVPGICALPPAAPQSLPCGTFGQASGVPGRLGGGPADDPGQFQVADSGASSSGAVQPAPGVRLPSQPALDVRNESIFRQDLFMVKDLYLGGRQLQLSDERFKTQVTALKGSLQLIGQLKAKEYSMAADPKGERLAGFLAQQLKQVFPQAVKVASDDTHFVAINDLIPHIVGAVQELHLKMQTDNEDFEERVGGLEAVLLAGTFHNLVDQQAALAMCRKPRPAGKGLGAAVAAGVASVTGRPTPGTAYPVTEEARRLFAGKASASIVQHLQKVLQDENPVIAKLYRKWLADFGPPVVAQMFLDATTKPTSRKDSGEPRSPAAEFIQLAKGLERDNKQREREEVAAAAAGVDERMLRGYQADMINLAAQGGNLIFVAPTGAGKTEVAVRYSARMLAEDSSAKVIFLAPTINLADQQAAEFRTSPSFRSSHYRVECRCGGKSVAPYEWPSLLKASSVVVLTPEIFRRLLASGAASFASIHLLIIDECHHCTGDHPAALILEHYQQWLGTRRPDAPPPTQVIGFTASPASKPTVNGTMDVLDMLHRRLLAQYVVINGDHPELQQHVAQAQDQRVLVNRRREDRLFAERLGGTLLRAVDTLGSHLQCLSSDGQLPPELRLRPEDLELLSQGLYSGAIPQWCASVFKFLTSKEASSEAEPEFVADLRCCLYVVDGAVDVLSVASNMGYEAAARRLAQLLAEGVQKLLGVASEVLLGRMAAGLGIPATAVQPGGGIDGLAMEVLRMLSEEALGATTLQQAYREGVAGTPRSPKYVAMKQAVLGYHEEHNAHGIIFVRTRADARVLHSILQSDEELRDFQVHLLMGHGGGSSADGMDVVKQREARQEFGAEGRHLLVATAAAEEGLNIPACQFVIRFSITQTGRERMQSKGRTRMRGSVYYELVEEGTQDERQANKSALEEQTVKYVLQQKLHALRL